MLVLALGTHDIMIFGGMNGKLPSKNSFWKWILCAEAENDEKGIPNSRDKIAIELTSVLAAIYSCSSSHCLMPYFQNSLTSYENRSETGLIRLQVTMSVLKV